MTWNPDDVRAQPVQIGLAGWLRVVTKGLGIAVVVFGGLLVLLILRVPESWVHGARRPWTSRLVPWASRTALLLIGLPLTVEGVPMRAHGGIVANHSSWLDIFTLSSVDRFYFVSKFEVAGWPLIGWLARGTGTVFIQRDRRDTRRQQALLNERLSLGHRLLFFPEGTSTDGLRILPFKSTLFEPFLPDAVDEQLSVQPVTVVYQSPPGREPRFYGWWGDMSFAPHLLKVLAAPRQGTVRIVFHAPVSIGPETSRKTLAQQCETVIRTAHPYGNI